MGNVNDLHHKDLFDKEMSLCDILGLPPTVTCIYNKSIDIIKTKKCQIPMSEAEYRCAFSRRMHSMYQPSLFSLILV